MTQDTSTAGNGRPENGRRTMKLPEQIRAGVARRIRLDTLRVPPLGASPAIVSRPHIAFPEMADAAALSGAAAPRLAGA